MVTYATVALRASYRAGIKLRATPHFLVEPSPVARGVVPDLALETSVGELMNTEYVIDVILAEPRLKLEVTVFLEGPHGGA